MFVWNVMEVKHKCFYLRNGSLYAAYSIGLNHYCSVGRFNTGMYHVGDTNWNMVIRRSDKVATTSFLIVYPPTRPFPCIFMFSVYFTEMVFVLPWRASW